MGQTPHLPFHKKLRALAVGFLLLAGLAGCKEKLPDARLDATVNQLSDHRIQVEGTTTLPDGANILVTFRQPGTRQPIVQALPVVKDHRFSTTLGPMESSIPSGTYEIYTMFSPEAFAWSEEVLPAVGQKGERLVGPQVRQRDNGVRILENSITFNYLAPPPASPMAGITPYGYEAAAAYGYGYGAPPP